MAVSYPSDTPPPSPKNSESIWRKSKRGMFNLPGRMFYLPGRTYSRLLHLILNNLPVDGQIHLRIIRFSYCMYTNNDNNLM